MNKLDNSVILLLAHYISTVPFKCELCLDIFLFFSLELVDLFTVSLRTLLG